MEISNIRLKELKKAEAKLNALEAGGVDNWDNYEYALAGYRAENELEEKRESLLYELEVAFGECAYEPSERGAGIAFSDPIRENCMAILEKFGVTFLEK